MHGYVFRRLNPRLCALLCCLAALGAASAPAVAQPTCAAATNISVGFATSGTNAGSPGDGFSGLCTPTNSAVWHWFVPAVSGPHTISLCSSAIDSVATLYNACGPASSFLTCDDDACGDDSIVVYSLSAGQAYFLRVASKGATSTGSYSVLVSAPPAVTPSNDFCGTPHTLPLNSTITASCAPTSGSDVSACGTLDTSDVWFTLNAATSGQYLIQACSSAFQPVISIHASCAAGTSLACSASGSTIGCTGGGSASLAYTPASTGNILVRVAGVRGSFGDFTLIAHAPRSNDLCSGAIPITLGVPIVGLTTPALATDTSVACAASSFDAWHVFIAPNSGLYAFSTCTGTDFDTVLSVHSACPTAPGAAVLACSDNACGNGSSVSVSLSGGTVIWIRVAGKNSAFGNYTLSSAILTPANDQCSAAATLLEGVPFSGNSAGASGTDLSSCGTSDTKDVWLNFVPAASTTYEFHTCGSTIDTVLSVFASCGGAELACSDNAATFCGGGAASFGSALTLPLQAGIAYKVRIAGATESDGPYKLAVARSTPANDQCEGATPIPLGSVVASTLSGATISGITACSRPASTDVWFSFTPAVTRHYRVQTCGSVATTVVSIHDACDPEDALGCGLAAPDICPTGGSSAVSSLIAGHTYYLRVADAANLIGGAVQVQVQNTAPSNDACAAAVPLALNVPTTGANLEATTDSSDTCAAGGRDVWYAFTPALSGLYQFRTCAGPIDLDTILSLHASCGSPATACSDDAPGICGPGSTGSALSENLTAGTTYLLRIAGKASAQGTFTIAVAQDTICLCDWDNSGDLEVQDIFDFLESWFARAGEFNGDGTLEIADIFAFLECWFAPPPPCDN